jgi:hypothetical protein
MLSSEAGLNGLEIEFSTRLYRKTNNTAHMS